MFGTKIKTISFRSIFGKDINDGGKIVPYFGTKIKNQIVINSMYSVNDAFSKVLNKHVSSVPLIEYFNYVFFSKFVLVDLLVQHRFRFQQQQCIRDK